MKSTNIIITVLLVVIVGGGAFFAGMKYQQSKQPTFNRQSGAGGGFGQRGGGPGGNRNGFRPVTGSIVSRDQNSITVKLSDDGSGRIVLITDKTTVNKFAEATKEDLKIGETVAAFGQENSDGTVTAQNVQLNPIQRSAPNPAPQP